MGKSAQHIEKWIVSQRFLRPSIKVPNSFENETHSLKSRN